MRYYLSILLLTLMTGISDLVSAQDLKGRSLRKEYQTVTVRKTWAVIVGISRFEKKNDLVKLAYADSDAVAFNRYLLDQADHINIKPSQIRLLLDTAATSEQILSSLGWMLENANSEDRVIFFFSGHGATDNYVEGNDSYLIATNHFGPMHELRGTVPVEKIKRFFSSFTKEEGVHPKNVRQAMLVIDACDAGNFESTESSLGEGWGSSKILKILSCYANMPSIESEEYKSGLFTHYFLKGLRGYADRDTNNVISMYEMQSYLMENVYEKHGRLQSPKVISTDPGFAIFQFDPTAYKTARQQEELLLQNKKVRAPQKKKIIYKGVVTSSVEADRYFKKFNDCIKANRLLYGKNNADSLNSAKYFFNKLIQVRAGIEMIADARLLFLNALQRKTARIFDEYVKETRYYLEYQVEDTKEAGEEMAYALTLLKQDDPLADYIRPRTLFMQSLLIKDNRKAIGVLRDVLRIEPRSSYANLSIGNRYLDIGKPDSAITYLKEVLAVSPNWSLACLTAGLAYGRAGNFVSAEFYFKKAIDLDPTYAFNYYALGTTYFNNGKFTEALTFLNLANKRDRDNLNYIKMLALTYYTVNNDDKAKYFYQKVISQEKGNSDAYIKLAKIEDRKNNFEMASFRYRAAISKDSTKAQFYVYLGNSLMNERKYYEAGKSFQNALNIEPYNAEALKAISKLSLESGNKGPGYFDMNPAMLQSPEYLLRSGVLMLTEKNDEGALTAFTAVLKSQPDNRLALDYTGRILLSQKRYLEAEPYFKALLKLRPKDADTYFALGEISENLEQYKSALAYLQKGIALAPHRTDKIENIGLIFYKLKEYNAALPYVEKAAALQNHYAYHYNAGITNQAIKNYQQASLYFLKAIASDSTFIESYIRLAEVDSEMGQFDQAAKYLSRAQQLKPNDAVIYGLLADAKRGLRDYVPALQNYYKAIKLDSTNISYLSAAGAVHLLLKDTANTIPLYRKAIAIKPGNTSLLHELGGIFAEKRNYPEAIKYYNQAIYSDPKYIYAYNDLAEVYVSKSFEKFNKKELIDKALPLYKKSLEIDSTDFLTLSGTGHLYGMLEDSEKEKAYYEKALKVDSTSYYVLNALANIYAYNGNPEEAVRLYELSIKLDSTSAYTFGELGRLYYEDLANSETAVHYLRKALAIDAKIENGAYYLGVAYLSMKRYKEALTYLQKAAVIKPKDPDPVVQLGNVSLAKSEFNTASIYYLKALKIQPNTGSAYMGMGNVAFARGQYLKAEGYFRRAIANGEDKTACLIRIAACKEALHQITAAINTVGSALSDPVYDRDNVFYLADLYMKNAQFAQAVALIKSVIMKHPDDSELPFKIGDLYRQKNKISEAETWYIQGGKTNKSGSAIRLGNLYFSSDTLKSKKHYQAAIDADSSIYVPYYNLGMLAISARNYHSALYYLSEAVKRDSLNTDIQNNLAEGFYHLNDTTRYLLARERVLQIKDNYENTIKLAQAYFEMDQYERALDFFNSALKKSPAEFRDFNELGLSCYHLNRLSDAIYYYMRGLKIDPQDSRIMNNLGLVYMEQKSYRLALINFKKSVGLRPGNKNARYNLVALYSLTKKIPQGIAELEVLLKNGYKDKAELMNDEDLENLRRSDLFKPLINMYL